jgi:carbon storage regulator
MLVLTRRSGEAIVIGDDVTVTVLEVRGDQIRLGIDAPRSVKVHRQEVFAEIERTNTEAVASSQRARKLLGTWTPPQQPGRPSAPTPAPRRPPPT